jgi:L-malate glycosyltransferase
MKIAYIYDALYPWVKGGAEKRMYEMARRMTQKGHEVHCYSWGWWWSDQGKKDIIYEGIHLHGIGEPRQLYSNNRRSIKEAILFAVKLLPCLWKENFDVVDCQGFPFFSCFTAKIHALTGRSTLIITLLEVWGDYWYTYIGFLGFFGKILEKMVLHLSNNIISISEKTKNDFLKIRKLKGTVIIPPGIDCKEISEVPPKKGEWDIIFAGRLIKEKNVDLLIASLPIVKKNNPHVSCLIIGDGPEMDNLKKLATELNLLHNLEFIGFLDNVPDVLGYMKSSKVFVLPSEREGFGMVVVEANACGIPVVVVEGSMNASVDLVKEGINGFIAKANENDVALKINHSLIERENLREKCIESATKYDWNNIIYSLENYYQNSLAGNAKN